MLFLTVSHNVRAQTVKFHRLGVDIFLSIQTQVRLHTVYVKQWEWFFHFVLSIQETQEWGKKYKLNIFFKWKWFCWAWTLSSSNNSITSHVNNVHILCKLSLGACLKTMELLPYTYNTKTVQTWTWVQKCLSCSPCLSSQAYIFFLDLYMRNTNIWIQALFSSLDKQT